MSHRQLPGQASPPAEQPDRVKPVPEHYKGVNFPYRGTEKHGVEVPEDARYDSREFEADFPDEDVDYLPPEDEPEPVPVRVVQGSARERLDWRAVRFHVTTRPQQVVGRHDKRRSLRIKVHSGVSAIYIGPDSGVTDYVGFKIDQNEHIDIRSTEEIWAVCGGTTDTSEISIMYEYGVEL